MLDAFAGTGALGLEALSRGAAHATFLERDRAALAALRANIAACRAGDRAAVLAADATRPPPGQPCTLVFLDPPYRQGLVQAALAALAPRGLDRARCGGGGRDGARRGDRNARNAARRPGARRGAGDGVGGGGKVNGFQGATAPWRVQGSALAFLTLPGRPQPQQPQRLPPQPDQFRIIPPARITAGPHADQRGCVPAAR